MKTKLLILRTTLALLLPVTLLSCNKWLDVKPDSQVKDAELFSSEVGFKEALSGVYTSLTYEPLYGRELTFGMMGVLGHEWDYVSTTYDGDKIYTYKSNANSITRIDAIWNGLYNTIANDNKLLEEIDAKKSVFTGDNYNIIKGESLALRAFIHFDLLRTFGASYEENPEKIAIPYVTESSKKIFPQLKVREVLDLVIADLKAAEELLMIDPIRTGRTVTTSDDAGYLINRKVHLNYYAVKGMLARVYLYKKDYVNALANAEVVIQTTTTTGTVTTAKFPWITSATLTNRAVSDLTFSTEHLFALNVVRLKTISDNAFTLTGGSSFYITRANLLVYYNTNSTDYRLTYQFAEDDFGNYYLNKYTQLESTAWPQSFKNKVPLLKLAEMYFIAAECLKTTNYTQAVIYINTVRSNRGLAQSAIAEADFEDVLAGEYRKEFIGEGQLFFYHKRKDHATIPNAVGLDLRSLKGYKLPIPLAEMENGVGRIDNQ